MVQLSTRHGILTPYTSFLADETTDLREVTLNRATTSERLIELEITSGRSAFYQREGKQMLKKAGQVNAPAYGAGAGGGGYGGGAGWSPCEQVR